MRNKLIIAKLFTLATVLAGLFSPQLTSAAGGFTLAVSTPSSVLAGENLKFTLTCKNTYNAPAGSVVGVTFYFKAENTTRGGIAFGAATTGGWHGTKAFTDAFDYNASKSHTFSVAPSNAKAGDKVKLTMKCATSGMGSESVERTVTVTAPAEPKATIASTVLPEVFKQEGADTSNFSELTVSQAKTVSNFTLDNKAVGTVVFTAPIDMSTEEFIVKYPELDKYVVISKGKIAVDSAAMPMLNVAATLTMPGLNLVAGQFEILKDGEPAGEAVSEVNYNAETKTLTFNVTGFSTYEVGPKVTVDQSSTTVSESSFVVTGTVGDLDSVVVIKNNSQPVNAEVELSPEGKFSQTVTLAEGKNTIEFFTKGVSGSEDTQSIEVTYAKPLMQRLQENLPLVIGGIIGILALIAVLAFVVVKKVLPKMKAKKTATVETETVSESN